MTPTRDCPCPAERRNTGHALGTGFFSLSGAHVTGGSGQPSGIKYNWKMSNQIFSKRKPKAQESGLSPPLTLHPLTRCDVTGRAACSLREGNSLADALRHQAVSFLSLNEFSRFYLPLPACAWPPAVPCEELRTVTRLSGHITGERQGSSPQIPNPTENSSQERGSGLAGLRGDSD